MSSLPSISVVIPAWNAARTLPATLASVLRQDHPDFEVIVVDDGSTDGTAEIARSFGDRVVCVGQENHGGPSRPRNVGLARARGELAAIFDADDLMEPGKLSAAARVLAAHPEADLLFTDFKVVDAEDRELAPSVLALYSAFRERLRPTGDPDVALIGGEGLFIELLRANFIGTSSVVARRAALLEAGGFDEKLLNGDDRDLWFRLAREGRTFAFLDRIGHAYRSLETGVTGRGGRRLPGAVEVLERQREFAADGEAARVWRRSMGRSLASHGWHLRHERRYAAAGDRYARSISLAPNFRTICAFLATLAMRLLRGGGRPLDA